MTLYEIRHQHGSIPACAGEPFDQIGTAMADTLSVYPRVCGGTARNPTRLGSPR